ncbi:MAG: T9SS type A sorting domain-containing protein [Fibrobacteres bacterium]|nr:T9SS type A sorting domain-containing protein [Fibrobacterota bacterium]
MKNLRLLLVLTAIIATSNVNAQWQNTEAGAAVAVLCMATSGSNLYAGLNGEGVYLSKDGGTTWKTSKTGLTDKYVYSIAVNGTNIFAGTNAGVFLSTNNCSTWTNVSSTLANKMVRSLLYSGTNLFAGTYVVSNYGVFTTTNNGTSWTEARTGLPPAHVTALAVSGSNLFAGTSGSPSSTNNGVFLSTDNGSLWVKKTTGMGNGVNVNALAISGTMVLAGTDSGVYISSNNGTLWTKSNTGLPANTIVHGLTVYGNTIFASTSGTAGGVYSSNNNGATWSAFNQNLITRINATAVNSTHIFACVNVHLTFGIWKRPIGEIIAVEKPIVNSASDMRLEQNHPNPFTPTTSISYLLPESQKGFLNIYSSNGTLIQSTKIYGNGTVKWNAENKAAGVYICKLITDKNTLVRKMLLAK